MFRSPQPQTAHMTTAAAQEAIPGLQLPPRERHSLSIVEHYLICAGGVQLMPDEEAHALTDTWVPGPTPLLLHDHLAHCSQLCTCLLASTASVLTLCIWFWHAASTTTTMNSLSSATHVLEGTAGLSCSRCSALQE